MNMIDAIILGAVQGATEFLPVSSKTHLIIGQKLLGIDEPSIFLEVALHIGTLLSVLIYYRKDVIKLLSSFFGYIFGHKRQANETNFRLGLYIIIGSIPAAIAGLLFKDWIEMQFDSTTLGGYLLLVTAAVLISTHFIKRKRKPIGMTNSFVVGIAQACALLPGISRSGSTISAALYQGIEPAQAARFSFLLSLPAVGGAVLLKAVDLLKEPTVVTDLASFGVGIAVSFIVGLLAIYWLLKSLAGSKFYMFGFYCAIVGVLTIIFL